MNVSFVEPYRAADIGTESGIYTKINLGVYQPAAHSTARTIVPNDAAHIAATAQIDGAACSRRYHAPGQSRHTADSAICAMRVARHRSGKH